MIELRFQLGGWFQSWKSNDHGTFSQVMGIININPNFCIKIILCIYVHIYVYILQSDASNKSLD